MDADDRNGPFFDSLSLGDVFDQAPSVTLTDGLAATHHAIVGGRFRLALDRALSGRVAHAPLVSPSLAWDVSIGQSTLVTQRAIANLFYRGLRFLRLPAIGDTLTTRVEIVGLRPAEPKPDRPPRGLVVMRIRTCRPATAAYPRLSSLRASAGPPRRAQTTGRQSVAGRWRNVRTRLRGRHRRLGSRRISRRSARPGLCLIAAGRATHHARRPREQRAGTGAADLEPRRHPPRCIGRGRRQAPGLWRPHGRHCRVPGQPRLSVDASHPRLAFLRPSRTCSRGRHAAHDAWRSNGSSRLPMAAWRMSARP